MVSDIIAVEMLKGGPPMEWNWTYYSVSIRVYDGNMFRYKITVRQFAASRDFAVKLAVERARKMVRKKNLRLVVED